MRGGARKGAGRKPTGKTRAPETFSLKLSTLSALEQSVPGGRRSGFVDAAICAALAKLVTLPDKCSPEQEAEFQQLAQLCGINLNPPRRHWQRGFHRHERKCSNVPQSETVPQVIIPKPFETI